jgi:hypothetical protein
MGAHQDSSPSGDNSLISFTVGSEKIIVRILTANDMLQRNRILEVLLHLTCLRSGNNQIYIVVPRLLGASLDAQVLRSQGIGLILFDERRIEETVKPRQVTTSVQPHSSASTVDPSVLSELATLKSMYAQIERTIEQIRAEFNSLKEDTPTQSPRLERHQQNLDFEPVMHPPQTPISPSQEPLPSFFTNNPWLDVLSKRGRPEVAPLAG